MSKNTSTLSLRLNHNTDADILSYLETAPSKQGAIKKAIRFYLSHKDKILDGTTPDAIRNYFNR